MSLPSILKLKKDSKWKYKRVSIILCFNHFEFHLEFGWKNITLNHPLPSTRTILNKNNHFEWNYDFTIFNHKSCIVSHLIFYEIKWFWFYETFLLSLFTIRRMNSWIIWIVFFINKTFSFFKKKVVFGASLTDKYKWHLIYMLIMRICCRL